MAIRRAIENLVGNALTHGTRARVGLQVAERTIHVAVEDDGPGIPPERRDEAMRPFTRLDAARNQDTPGVASASPSWPTSRAPMGAPSGWAEARPWGASGPSSSWRARARKNLAATSLGGSLLTFR
jgi:hypothetical protein